MSDTTQALHDALRVNLKETHDAATAAAAASFKALQAGMRGNMARAEAAFGAMAAAQVRWVLAGEPGSVLDGQIGFLVNAGYHVEMIEPGRKYRLNGDREACDRMVTPEDKRAGASVTIAREMPPDTTITVGSTAAPDRPHRRRFTVHGCGDANTFIARAIDRGLSVEAIGINRYAVSGRTGELLAWAAAVVHGKTVAEVMELHRITPEMVASEDGVQPVIPVHVVSLADAGVLPVNVLSLPDVGPLPVNVVSLPARKTVAEVSRDATGEIREVVHTETDA